MNANFWSSICVAKGDAGKMQTSCNFWDPISTTADWNAKEDTSVLNYLESDRWNPIALTNTLASKSSDSSSKALNKAFREAATKPCFAKCNHSWTVVRDPWLGSVISFGIKGIDNSLKGSLYDIFKASTRHQLFFWRSLVGWHRQYCLDLNLSWVVILFPNMGWHLVL